MPLRHALQLDQIVARAISCQQCSRVLEPLADGGAHLVDDAVVRLDVPLCEQDAAVRCSQLKVLPLAQVVVILEPFVLKLANELLVQPPGTVVDGLHLVSLARWYLPY